MTLTFKLIRPLPTLDLGQLSRALRAAVDPTVELRDFQMTLRGAARARQEELGAASDDFRFAMDGLLPLRVRGIDRHLNRGAVDAQAFSNFVRHLSSIAQETIVLQDNPDEIAEVVTALLDDLHAYVLAHALVGPGYLAAERELAKRLFEGGDTEPVAAQGPTARDRDLVLAA